MRGKPLFLAVAIGAGLQIVYTILTTGTSMLVTFPLIESAATQTPNTDFIQVLPIASTLLACLTIILTPLAHTGVGVLYTLLARREAEISPEDGALGGALSAGLARFTTGLVSVAIMFTIMPMLLSASTRLINQPMPPELGSVIPFMLLSTGMGGIFSTCMGAVIAAALGALGGVLSAAVLESRRSA